MREIINAKITSTSLGVDDAPCFTCWLYLEWEGGGVGFGGYSLDVYDEKADKRVGYGPSIDFLQEIMDVVGVSKWEDLKGKYIRLDTEGWGGRALGIGNLLKDKWVYPKEFFKQYE
jgi:hypothetical protein